MIRKYNNDYAYLTDFLPAAQVHLRSSMDHKYEVGGARMAHFIWIFFQYDKILMDIYLNLR